MEKLIKIIVEAQREINKNAGIRNKSNTTEEKELSWKEELEKYKSGTQEYKDSLDNSSMDIIYESLKKIYVNHPTLSKKYERKNIPYVTPDKDKLMGNPNLTFSELISFFKCCNTPISEFYKNITKVLEGIVKDSGVIDMEESS